MPSFAPKAPPQPQNVLSHWFVPMDGFHFSAVDFYDRVEASLAARKVPQLRQQRVEYHEGGAFSDRRLYLRLARERFSFEVCAAPFGTGYFFSLRFVEVPRGGWIMLILIMMGALSALGIVTQLAWQLVYYMTFQATGWFWLGLGAADVLAIVAVLALRKRKAAELSAAAPGEKPTPVSEMPDFDSLILDLPVIGEWYERRRKETYYRHDTRLMYQTVVSEIVKKHVEELTVAKGIRLLRAYDHNPFLTEFYKTTTIPAEPSAPSPPPHGLD